MIVSAFRLENFMGFRDTNWIELRPITLLFGRNSAGKSAILRALLLLRQSLEASATSGPLLLVKDGGFDFEGYSGLVRDHQMRRRIFFWFRCELTDQEKDSRYTQPFLEQFGSAGSYLVLRLMYGSNKKEKARATFLGADVYDQAGNVIIKGTAQTGESISGGSWHFESSLFDLDDEHIKRVWPYLELYPRDGFLPGIRFVEGESPQEPEPPLSAASDPYDMVKWVLKELSETIQVFLRHLEYVGPLRSQPRRFYYVAGSPDSSVLRERNIVRDLIRSRELLDAVNDWLSSSKLRVRLEPRALDNSKTLYELRLTDIDIPARQGAGVNICEAGFGLSQILPIVVQLFMASEGSIVLIEQPELHLHPSAQAAVANLFVLAIAHGIRLLIETHSEHLLLRFRHIIGRTTLDKVKNSRGLFPKDHEVTAAKCSLGAGELAAYFVEWNKETRISEMEPILFDSRGQFIRRPEGFKRFFSDDFDQVMQINRDIAEMSSLEQ